MTTTEPGVTLGGSLSADAAGPATPAPRGGPSPQAPQDRPESARERVNRRWAELLQETRVAQIGVQILLGFLLGIAFTQRFGTLGAFERGVYVVTVLLGALSAAALIAPVSIHRFLAGRRMKEEIVAVAGRLMICGLVLLALTIGAALLLLLGVVLPGTVAYPLVGGVMLWFVLCWYVLPFWLRSRSL